MHPKDRVPDDGKGVDGESARERGSSSEDEEDDLQDGSSGSEEDGTEESGSESEGEDGESEVEDGESEVEDGESGSGEEGSEEEPESGEASDSEEDEDDTVKPGKRSSRRTDAFVESDSSDGQADRCPICLSRFLGQDLGSPESCEHMFCLDCIMEWSQNMNTCPVDRHIFKLVFMRKTPDGKVLKKLPAQAQNAVPEEEEDATPCEICGRSDREDRLLLCDGCDQGFHLDCLNPPLATVPVEEWFCRQCDTDNNRDNEREESEQDIAVRDDNDAERLTRPRRRTAHVGGTRLLPRTRQSELVRRRIQLTRATRMRTSDSEEPSTSGVRPAANGAVVRRPRRTTKTTRRRKTVRRKTTKRRRKTTSRKSSATSSATKKGGTTKRRKTRRRRKTKTRKTKVRLTRKTTVPSARARLADQLGVKKKLPHHFLPVMKEPSTSRWNRGRAADLPIGRESLQLFGQRDGLYAFADSNDDGDEVATVRGVPAHLIARPRKTLSASAILSRRPVGLSGLTSRIVNRVPAVTAAATSAASFDLLGDILNCQTLLQKSSKDVIITRDGTLRVPAPVAAAAPTKLSKGAAGGATGGAANQCPMQPSRSSQSVGSAAGSTTSQSGGNGAKEGSSSSSSFTTTTTTSRSGQLTDNRSSRGDGNDGRAGNRNATDIGGSHAAASSTADARNKTGKKSDEKENKKSSVETDDDIDIYSDIETGSLENDGGDADSETGAANRSADDLEMADGGGDSAGSMPGAFDSRRRASELGAAGTVDGGEDSRDGIGRQSDVSSEDDLVIDESVKPVEEEDDDDECSNNEDSETYKRASRFGSSVVPQSGNGGGGSEVDSEENDLVIDDDRDASNDSRPPAPSSPRPEDVNHHDDAAAAGEASSADEDGAAEPSPKHDESANQNGGEDDDDSKAAAEENESCSENEESERVAVDEPTADDREAGNFSNENSDEDNDEDKIVEEYNRNAAKNKELGKIATPPGHGADQGSQDADGDDDEAMSSGDENEDADAVDASREEDAEPADGAVSLDEEDAALDSLCQAAMEDVTDDEEPVEDVSESEIAEEADEELEESAELANESAEPLEEAHDDSDQDEARSGDANEEQDETAPDSGQDEVDPTEEDAEQLEDETEEAAESGQDGEQVADNEEEEAAPDSGDEEPAEIDPENELENYPSDDLVQRDDGEQYAEDSEQQYLEESLRQLGEGEQEPSYNEESGDRDNVLTPVNDDEVDDGEKSRRDRSGHRRRDALSANSTGGLSASRRHVESPTPRATSRRVPRGTSGGGRDYEEGEIVDDSPPQHRRRVGGSKGTRKLRPDSPPDTQGFENYEKDMPRVNISALPRIPKIRREGGQSDKTSSPLNYDPAFDAAPPGDTDGGGQLVDDDDRGALERERAMVLARLEEDRAAAAVSWKKLSQNSKTRNYRDNKAKAEHIRHVRGGDRKTSGVVTITTGGVIDQTSSRKWTSAPPEPPPQFDRERDRERERGRADKDKKRDRERGGGGGPEMVSGHRDSKERLRNSKESRDARLKENRDSRLRDSKDARLNKVSSSKEVARLKERGGHDRGRSGSSKHEKERFKEKDKHKTDRHKNDKTHRDWKDKPKRSSGHLDEPVPERGRERLRDSASGGGGSRYDKRDKLAPLQQLPPPPLPAATDRKEKRERKTRGEKSRVPERVSAKHREHRKQREKDKAVVSSTPVAAQCSREPSPIESKEVYASGDSIIVNVNFSRPPPGAKDTAAEVLLDDVSVARAQKIKERERERDPIKKLEIELRERKRQRLSEMEAQRKERSGASGGGGSIGRERAKKRGVVEHDRGRRDVGKRSRLDPSRLGPPPRREVVVKGGVGSSAAAAAPVRWNPFAEEADESLGSQKSGGSISPITIRDDEDDDDQNVSQQQQQHHRHHHHHHHQIQQHSFEDNSEDDDVVEILPSPEDDVSKGGGYQSDEPRTPIDEDTTGGEDLVVGAGGGVGSGDFATYDSPPNEPRAPCSPPSPAEDNDSVYDPFEPTKSPSPLSSPDRPASTTQLQPPLQQPSASSSVATTDPPPLPPDMQPPQPPPEPPELDAIQPVPELASIPSQPIATPTQPVPPAVAATVTAVGSVTPVLVAQPPPVSIVQPVVTPTVAPVPTATPPQVRGLLPPMSMPNIRVPPPNYIPRSAAPTATPPTAVRPHVQQMTATSATTPRPLAGWSVGAPGGLLFAAPGQQAINRPTNAASAFLRPPPPMGTRPMSLSQIGTLLHSQIASMQQGMRGAPQHGVRAPLHASGLRLQVPLGLPAALLQQSFGSLQQLAQSLSAGMPVGAAISQNGELKRGATGHAHQDATTEVVDMDVDSPYSPGDTNDADGGPSGGHAPRMSRGGAGGGDRFDALTGSRKENVPTGRGDKGGGGGGGGGSHASSSGKNRAHGSRGSASRRKGAESASHSQRKHIVRFEVPERQQAKAARSGGQKDGGAGKKGEDGKKMDETQLKILDELPSSAVEMQVKEKFLKKLNRQERVIEEVKLAIKPFYNRREITKEEYKEILRKSVPKICHNKAGDINPVKIKALVDGYIRKFKYNRKKETKIGSSKKS